MPSGREPGEGAAPGRRDRRGGLGELDLARVPHRLVVDLARYGMAARAQALRPATLLATVTYLGAKSIDDCLELLDL